MLSGCYYFSPVLTVHFAQKMAPPDLDCPSKSTLDQATHLLFGDDAPSVGTSRSRHSASQHQGMTCVLNVQLLIVLNLE
jgi:hypothetical protein